jgi:hypothetical protein
VIFDVGGKRREVHPEVVVVAGFTGRDTADVAHHVAELEAIGVRCPTTLPCFWRLPAHLGLQVDRLGVVGGATSGEAEVCLVVDGDDVLVTLASDHTDREVEASDLAVSKRVCPKVVARAAWTADSLGGRWSELALRSWIVEDGREVVYQDGTTGALISPPELLARLPFPAPRSFVMLTGTVPAIGGVRASSVFRAELHDPAHDRTIHLRYDIADVDAAPAPSEAAS